MQCKRSSFHFQEFHFGALNHKMKKLLLLRFLLIILLLDVCSTAYSNLASDRSALLAVRMAIGARFLPWNISDQTPCNWTGVTCLLNQVVELRLQKTSSSLRFNALSGPLPAEIGNLTSLRNLYLQGNFFSGDIPESLFNLQSLVSLNLAHNNFTGTISPNFNNLTRLATLSLEGNQLRGSIPYLNLAYLDHFNVSFNKLTGLIPETLSGLPASSFEGNSLCGKPLLLCNGGSIGDSYILSGSGGIAGILIGCFFGCLCQRKIIKKGVVKVSEDSQHSNVAVKDVEISIEVGTAGSGGAIKGEATEGLKQREEVEISVEEGVADSDHSATTFDGGADLEVVKGKNSLEFDLEDLLRAPAEMLGKGTFGTTYKVDFQTGRTVAIKRLRDFNVSEKEFEDMVEAIEKMNNQNLVPIRAYHYSEDDMLLVYEYMHMGSLYALLHGDKGGGGRSSLSWETRTGIALGAARAIMHIHDIDPSTCHGNIKSSNVFLTATSKVRVSEYGLANVAGSTNIDGYLAPELIDTGKVSQKADVYSFGVLLLELITRKDPTESHLKDEGLDLPRWILSAVDGEWTSALFDVELLQHENMVDIMLQFLELTFSCTAQHPGHRPSMAEVINQIKRLCSSSLQAEKDPAMNENVFGQIYKGPKAWKIFNRKNKELQQRFNSRDGNIETKGLVFFGNKPDVFDLEDLLRASAEVLGKGTLGTTYKASFETGKVMCVKRFKNLYVRGDEFHEMVKAVGKINHENLICLRAYYHSKDESLLVQDYMRTGSLSDLLHGSRGSGRTPLNWETRCSIALGAARGIEYIHSQSAAMCHGKIKSSNILLTENYEACVSDFGLAKVAGDYRVDGYSSPEATDASKVSQKADIYSFGVLLMELLTGKAPNNSSFIDEGVNLPRWIQAVVREEWTAEVFDVELIQYADFEEDMIQLLQIALSCIALDPDKRPSMTKLKFQIKKLIRPISKVGEGDKSFEQMEDGKIRFGQMISIPDEGR